MNSEEIRNKITKLYFLLSSTFSDELPALKHGFLSHRHNASLVSNEIIKNSNYYTQQIINKI